MDWGRAWAGPEGIWSPVQVWGLHIRLTGGLGYGGRKTGHRTERCFGEKHAIRFLHVQVSSGG